LCQSNNASREHGDSTQDPTCVELHSRHCDPTTGSDLLSNRHAAPTSGRLAIRPVVEPFLDFRLGSMEIRPVSNSTPGTAIRPVVEPPRRSHRAGRLAIRPVVEPFLDFRLGSMEIRPVSNSSSGTAIRPVVEPPRRSHLRTPCGPTCCRTVDWLPSKGGWRKTDLLSILLPDPFL